MKKLYIYCAAYILFLQDKTGKVLPRLADQKRKKIKIMLKASHTGKNYKEKYARI